MASRAPRLLAGRLLALPPLTTRGSQRRGRARGFCGAQAWELAFFLCDPRTGFLSLFFLSHKMEIVVPTR